MATKTKRPPMLKFKHKLDDLVWVMRRNAPMRGQIVSRTLHEGDPYNKIEYRIDFKYEDKSTKYPDWEIVSHYSTLYPTKEALIESLTAE